MKNSTFKNILLTILLALPLVGMAQNVTLTTQDQVDAFTHTSITGDLTIQVNSITSLAELSVLTSVGGNLTINRNVALSSLSGLEGLNRVGGNLNISYNNALGSLSGLDNLNRVEGNLTIRYNDALNSLSGLDALTSVGGLFILRNAVLNSLSALDDLNRVEGNLTISINRSLSTLSGLENITTLGGSLNIGTDGSSATVGNIALINLCGVQQLITNGQVTGVEYFVKNNAYNPLYTEIREAESCSLDAATTFAGNKTFRNQGEIDNFNAIYIRFTGNLTINDTEDNNITNLTALRSLISVGGNLFISSNAALSSLSGLDGINRVGGYLNIRDNATLTSLNGLEGINRVESYLQISSNTALNSLSGLENITTLGGNLYIGTNSSDDNVGNPSLANLCDVRQLITNGEITNAAYFVENNGYNPNYAQIQETDGCSVDATTTYLGDKTFGTQAEIEAFRTIYTRITGNLTIQETTDNSIISLSGLRGINRVGGNLSIYSNAALSSLSGLENITTLGRSLNIGTNSSDAALGNSALTNLCGVRQLITDGEVTIEEYFVGNNVANPEYAELQNAASCIATTYTGSLTLTSQTVIDGFPYTNITGNLTIQETTANNITNLTALHSLISVDGNLSIYSNAALNSLSGLENITTLGGSLYIGANSSEDALGNSALTNLCSVRQLITEVDEDMEYFVENNGYNPNYAQIQEAISCSTTYTEDLTFENQAGIDAFLTTYTSITGDLTINDTTTDNKITSLARLRSLMSVDGNLSIYSNTALNSLSGLENITTLGGSLNIGTNSSRDNVGNPNLANLCSVRQLINDEQVTSMEYFVYNNGYNPNYAQIQETDECSVDPTTTYLGHKTFETQAEMDMFSTTTTYTRITGNLTIQETMDNSIISLSGLRGINRVGGNLSIYSNAALSSLSGLENITILGGSLNIGRNSSDVADLGNSNLTNLCAIRQLITEVDEDTEYFVMNNGYNPNYAQIQNASSCSNISTASVGDFIEKGESIIIYPNPAKDILHTESEESITFVEIINTLGQVVLKTTESKDIHIGFLPSGVYFVKVTDDLKATLVKILKN